MLLAGQSSTVTFKVNVVGTAITPVVKVVLSTSPELTFPATRLDSGDWQVELDIPSSVSSGDYELRVDVLLGDRIFSPTKKTVTILGVRDEVAYQEPETVETVATVTPVQTIDTPKSYPSFFAEPKKAPTVDASDLINALRGYRAGLGEAKIAAHVSFPAPRLARLETIKETSPVPMMKLASRFPIRLEKGEVIYE